VSKQYATDEFPGSAALIAGDWKLLRMPQKNGGEELYLFNLADDPAEKKNLLEEQPQIAKRMQLALEKWQTSVVHSLNGEDY